MTIRTGTWIKLTGTLLLLVSFYVSLRSPGPVKATTVWDTGDLVIAVGAVGTPYNLYGNDGSFKETIVDTVFGSTGITGGAAFNPDRTALYTTYWQMDRVIVFDVLDANHKAIQMIDTGVFSPGGHPQAIVFDRAGNFYVGNHQNAKDLLKYDPTGSLIAHYFPAPDSSGPGGLALSTDQATMFYTAEGRKIKRFDVVANVQLPDFAVLPGAGSAHELRLLPPEDGSGGLLVADDGNIKRVDASGTTIQTYTAAGEGAWLGLDLDPNGTSFWAKTLSGRFYRFNITTGAIEDSGQAPAGGSTVTGLVVMPAPVSGGGCPFLPALRGDPNWFSIVSLLYRYRDEVLGTSTSGRGYVELFYARAPEVARILLLDADLRRRSHDMITRHLGSIESILSGHPVLLAPSDVRDIERLLDAIAAKGSVTLQSDIRRVKLSLRAGEFKPFGVLVR